MKKQRLKNNYGYSLFELIVVMIVISILMTASMSFMSNSVDVSKVAETKEELNQIAHSIKGNESMLSGNHRTDYGYIGDIGSLPISLNNLTVNPGLATWDGPYIKDDFYASAGAVESEYLIDGWGKSYSYSNGISISSTGGSTTITKELANSTDDLLYNSVSFNIVDLGNCPPGAIYKDSLLFQLTYPNGLGSYQTDSKYPTSGGFILFDSIPIGQQSLSVVELTSNDTLRKKIYINTNSSFHSDIQIPSSLWCDTTSSGGGGSGGGASGVIEFVSGSAQTLTGQCNRVDFDIINNSGSDIDISNIIVEVASTTIYYQKITLGASVVVNQTNPKATTGTIAIFSSTQTISNGQTISIRLENFYTSSSGGNKVDMSNRDLTITFSDGSVITFNAGPCS